MKRAAMGTSPELHSMFAPCGEHFTGAASMGSERLPRIVLVVRQSDRCVAWFARWTYIDPVTSAVLGLHTLLVAPTRCKRIVRPRTQGLARTCSVVNLSRGRGVKTGHALSKEEEKLAQIHKPHSQGGYSERHGNSSHTYHWNSP